MMVKEKKSTKMFYSMGEVAEMFDVTQSLLRFWEKRFDVLKPKKNAKGNRMFTPEDIENLKIIYHLVKEKGMTLAGAEKYMKDNRKVTSRDVEIIERLQSIRAALVEIRDELEPPAETDIVVKTVIEPEPEPVVASEPEKPRFVELTLF